MIAKVLNRDVALLLGAVVVLGLAYVKVGSQGQVAQPLPPSPNEILGPTTWVPFSAAMRLTSGSEQSDVAGRFFRAGDGSSRVESGPPSNRQFVIGITNISELHTYFYSAAAGYWMSMPLSPDAIPRIPQFRVDNVRWFLHPQRIENFMLLRWVDPMGNVHLRAPELNGEAIVQQAIDGGRRELYNINLGEQPAELFRPPPGANVQVAPPEVQERMRAPAAAPEPLRGR